MNIQTKNLPVKPLSEKNHIYPNMEKKIALIIDCDNAKADAIYGLKEELSKFSETSIRRACGNSKSTVRFR